MPPDTHLQDERRYPRFSRRLQAAIWDGVLLSVVFVFSGIFISEFALPTPAKIAFVVAVILILEPGLVSLTGSTVGHYMRGLKVEDAKTGRKLGLGRAFFRFVVKSVLGWYSLMSILITKKHQALHDMTASSVVILRDPENFAQTDQMTERAAPDPDFVFPSRGRRAMVALAYIALSFFLFSAVVLLSLSEGCLINDRCSPLENAIADFGAYVWLGFVFVLIYWGANGYLWGARKRRRGPQV